MRSFLNKGLLGGAPIEELVLVEAMIDHHRGTFKLLLLSRNLAIVVRAFWLFSFTNLLSAYLFRILEIC